MADQPGMMLAPGSRVEAYEVLRLAAIGAMCHVYEARAPHLGRPVALKVLDPMWSSDQAIVTRLFNEARILGTIRHPHIVSLLSSGSLLNGSPYMVLEWLPGNLARVIADVAGPLKPKTAARIALQIAQALTALHARGIVHRDLKPANVLLDRSDLLEAQARLADLGLAKVRPDERGQMALGHVSTGGSAMLGTWDYMAPEQWLRSKSSEPSADVYSLGVLLFQMLAGRLPFVAEQPKDLMALHLFESPPMARLPEDTPPLLRELLEGMLSKVPPTRPRLEDVLGVLTQLGHGTGCPEPEPIA